MKNIQVIDGADNCVYDIYQIEDHGFDPIFSCGTDIAFIEDLEIRSDWADISIFIGRMWARRIPKKNANGIRGLLFYQMQKKKKYYPSLVDEEAINPNGSRLRATE